MATAATQSTAFSTPLTENEVDLLVGALDELVEASGEVRATKVAAAMEKADVELRDASGTWMQTDWDVFAAAYPADEELADIKAEIEALTEGHKRAASAHTRMLRNKPRRNAKAFATWETNELKLRYAEGRIGVRLDDAYDRRAVARKRSANYVAPVLPPGMVALTGPNRGQRVS